MNYEVFRDVPGFIQKPISRKTLKGRKIRAKQKHTGEVRDYVFARERNICRVTRFLPAVSMHELRPRSLGGKVSRRNSIAVDGDGVNGTHGFLQRREITYAFEDDQRGAEGPIIFTIRTPRAADHCRVKVGESIYSAPMREIEAES